MWLGQRWVSLLKELGVFENDGCCKHLVPNGAKTQGLSGWNALSVLLSL